ncbi:MAG: GbsR/MarR family transcriptional regulator [Candidatus Binataceae bacterium]
MSPARRFPIGRDGADLFFGLDAGILNVLYILNVMDTITAGFVDGIGAAAATSGVLSQLQGRIFALLYLTPEQLSLDQIADELQQSKSNISVNIRGLVEWHLVRRVSVERSRKDHYEAATNFWLVMREIMERRFRWNLRQVVASVAETSRALETGSRPGSGAQAEKRAFINGRLERMRAFFAIVDSSIGAFTQGQSVAPQAMQKVIQLAARQTVKRR